MDHSSGVRACGLGSFQVLLQGGTNARGCVFLRRGGQGKGRKRKDLWLFFVWEVGEIVFLEEGREVGG